ncbi:YqhG family protein [Paenibacillus periandrae]|uniref:YqhG family protein n=1 Tax=Paenibacillus periandrae TaxID=1761741 RepID=UPI001F096425|nr:YqhG family protein [Paenibacillus periandrae]
MKPAQIERFVMRFLQAEKCDIIEKHPAYVTAKLSPSADKELTFRPYYWSFVERTGVVPETMTCTFIFDPDAHKAITPSTQPSAGNQPPQAVPGYVTSGGISVSTTAAVSSTGDTATSQPQPDSILGRYFGFVPTQITARIPKDEVTFGSRRLLQLFDVVRSKGKFVHLYEQFIPDQPKSQTTSAYENWLQVNFKVELACDMKRSEIHSLGIHLGNGEIRRQFQELLLTRQLTPRLPAHVFLNPDTITLARAVLYLEQHLEQLLRGYDHRWAEEAGSRLQEEIDRINSYYKPLIESTELEHKAEIEQQYTNRRQEIEWQYRPRIMISVINCGLFHLQTTGIHSR